MCLREVPTITADTPESVVDYWRENIETAPWFDPMKENLVVIALNTRCKIIAHNLVSIGTVDTCSSAPREIFRPLVAVSATSFILCHNHPSGESNPSDCDIKFTRDLVRASQIMKIPLKDHLVFGRKTEESRGFHSLAELGYLYC